DRLWNGRQLGCYLVEQPPGLRLDRRRTDLPFLAQAASSGCDLAHSPVPFGKMRQQARRGYRRGSGVQLAHLPGESPCPVVPADRARGVEAVAQPERVGDGSEDRVGSARVQELEECLARAVGVLARVAAQILQERLLELLAAIALRKRFPPGPQRIRVV